MRYCNVILILLLTGFFSNLFPQQYFEVVSLRDSLLNIKESKKYELDFPEKCLQLKVAAKELNDCKLSWEADNLLANYFIEINNINDASIATRENLEFYSDCLDYPQRLFAVLNRVRSLFFHSNYPECVSLYEGNRHLMFLPQISLTQKLELFSFYLSSLIILEDYNECIQVGQSDLAVLKSFLKTTEEAGLISYNQILVAVAAFQAHRFDLAKDLFFKSRKFQIEFCPQNELFISEWFLQSAYLYFEMGDYALANKLAIKGLEALKRKYKADDPMLSWDFHFLYNAVGETYSWNNNPLKGLFFLKKAENHFDKFKGRNVYEGDVQVKIAESISKSVSLAKYRNC